MSQIGIKNLALLLSGAGLVVAGGAFWASGPAQEEAPPALATATATAEADPQNFTPNPALPVVTVWKSPACGCCGAWVDHMRAAGFAVEVYNVDDVTPKKRELGVGAHLQSCHTSLVDGYALEGHVPAADVMRLLEERPQVMGIAVPGMPIGSPGMEMGGQRDRYDVLTFDREGRTEVWASHP